MLNKNYKYALTTCCVIAISGCSSPTPFQRQYVSLPKDDHGVLLDINNPHAQETTITPDGNESIVIQAAVDECARAVRNDTLEAEGLSDIEGLIKAGAGVFTFPATTVSTLLTAASVPFVGNTTTPPAAPDPAKLWTAGKNFVENNKNIQRTQAYYQGLYNTVGYACPSNQQLFGSFKFEKLRRQDKPIYDPVTPKTADASPTPAKEDTPNK